MLKDKAGFYHQRSARWRREDILLGALVWTFIVLLTFVWTHREAISIWLASSR